MFKIIKYERLINTFCLKMGVKAIKVAAATLIQS